MPLHLLGKKSWNVYNPANIEKVKRDEAAAAAREEAEEQRMQEVDAERRMRILRGLPVDDLPPATETPTSERRSDDARGPGRERKRRRIAGEDDTDRDMRYAMEDQAMAHKSAHKNSLKSKTSDAPLMDRSGHINLFPTEARKESREQKARNPEKEVEDAKMKQEYEDQYTMRFSNAAGFKQAVEEKPWYYTKGGPSRDQEEVAVSKDIFGNEDPRRKDRQKMRLAVDDPLAAIQKGVQGVRKADKEKKDWREKRLAEVDDSVEYERKEAKRRRKHRSHRSEEEELEGFNLDASEPQRHKTKHGHRHRHDHHNEGESRHRHHHHRSSRRRDRSRSPRRKEDHLAHPADQSAVPVS